MSAQSLARPFIPLVEGSGHEGVSEADHRKPGPVGVDVDEREPVGAGVLEAADVVFDVSVSTHVHIELDGAPASSV